MDKQYLCYCGLYCGNCVQKVRVEPAANTLYAEMKQAGFDDFIHAIPGGTGFWSFLKGMTDQTVCRCCHQGCGNPDCAIRTCAKEKGVEMCAFCEDYPCAHFSALLKAYPTLGDDNVLLREKGMDAWAELQDERVGKGFYYTGNK